MSTAQKPPDPYIGRSLANGQFVIDQKIGSGGMGAVYRVRDTQLDAVVALKLMRGDWSRPAVMERFRQEV